MAELRSLLERLLERQDLSETEASELLVALTDASIVPAMAGALLAALRAKGVTAAEVRGFASAMRGLARRPQLPPAPRAIDVVGTGGDASGSFNLSTGAALLVAAMGVQVVKHGNRSVSSRSGSADLLESLGLPLPLDERAAGECLAATGFTFLFAPHYHPAMKEVAPVRRALGVRTVFNLLGPLTNPAAPPYGLIGAYSSDAARLMAETLAGLPIERVFVIHGDPGWDEATPVGPFELYDVAPGRVRREFRDPRDLGIARCTAADLAGGDADHNAVGLRAVFEGRDRGPHRDAIVLNAALALEVTGTVPDAADGVHAASDAIDRGDAARLLQRLAAFGAR
ncbi:MAG: anthranilate phosphoribosyltransferase [Lysobacterales bacterium]|jgi:anthranilate phosphoribosyltransferase|nr:MAG: anthranilate phosphoribosyltransferase [Xanthomonadales bacterium]